MTSLKKHIRSKHRKRRSKKAGLAPGSLVYVGDREASVRISIIDYNENELSEKETATPEECLSFRDNSNVTWINIDGVNDTALIQKIGEHYGIHPLVLEDIVHTTQRPKIEDHDDYIFIVLRMLAYDESKASINSEQISFILRKNTVLSFQEYPGDIFGPIRERLRTSKGRLRKYPADYLTYALFDAIVDHYFLVIEKIGERLEELEDLVLADADPQSAHTIHHLKQEMILIRKAVWPLREVISSLQRLESPLISESTGIFLRDLYDHTVQVIDSVESYRDILSGMLEIYLASVSNKMNEIMKVLTIISTIFIPLTFIAGLYGMNFKYMPELDWRWGYAFSLGLMVVVAAFMLAFFRRKKWL